MTADLEPNRHASAPTVAESANISPGQRYFFFGLAVVGAIVAAAMVCYILATVTPV